MAFSDYVTDDEWDGMFYLFVGPRNDGQWKDFGVCMHAVVDLLLKAGCQPPGLDAAGNRLAQIPNNRNGHKLVGCFIEPREYIIIASYRNGRDFVKKHLPELLTETDEEWAAQMAPFEPKGA